MATLVLAATGSAIGAGFGGTVLGLTGAAIGQAVGASVGRMIDSRLLGGSSTQKVEGPRLDSLDVMASREGAGMPSLDGRAAIAGEVIWSTRLEEVKSTSTEKAGGKGGGPKIESSEYEYFANFAVGIALLYKLSEGFIL